MADNPRNDINFGNGEVGGDNRWTPPVHGTLDNGQEVTASFGIANREGQLGISNGHLSGQDYYGKNGHDHLDQNGNVLADRGRTS